MGQIPRSTERILVVVCFVVAAAADDNESE